MKAKLVFKNGTEFDGVWHGGRESAGEVVFNTSHSGYEEIASDPSYYKQIVVMCSPHQGNYGIKTSDWESTKVQASGIITLQLQSSIRNSQWLKTLIDHHVPIVSEFPTRDIVFHVRGGGSQWGALVKAERNYKERAFKLIEDQEAQPKDWVYECTTKKAYSLKGENKSGPRVAVLDLGTKLNILRLTQKYASEIIVFPSRTDASEILKFQAQALILTNGPGDPSEVKNVPQTIQAILGKIPIYGICMGHQLLAIALGASTYKLKFGHRGANHPIRDSILNLVYVSSQNHGYAVDAKTLPAGTEVTHLNLNDQTLAGLINKKLNCRSVQFHPESCPGPHEAQALFENFFSGI